MKCPKCDYLGFETGDRCKNCGYDFSLLTAPPPAPPEPEVTIRLDDPETGAPELWLDRLDRSMDEASKPSAKQEHLIGVPEPPPATITTPDTGLPLFNPDDPDDIPLIALPASPRPPLAVRRTAETPRLRAVPRISRTSTPAPALDFKAETDLDSEERREERFSEPRYSTSRVRPSAGGPSEVGGRRFVATLVDYTILLAIDVAVVYFTLRMAGLATAEIGLLPVAPLVTFLFLLKLAYFTAFTAVGGQTIGKMAMAIRVIDEHGRIDSSRALKRTFAGLLSVLTLGIGFLPAFFGADRRTLHDRLSGTRVVGLPSA
jgi:uncharacterized RDD family membrane protein YckC